MELVVVVGLHLHVLLGEDAQAEDVLEDHVVLEGPGVGEVVLESGVVAVVAHLLVPHVEVLGEGLVELSDLLVALELEELGVGADAHDALDGEVDVVGRGTHEVVGAELVAGVGEELDEVVGPLLEEGPVGLEPLEVVAGALDDGEHELEHVAGLLDGHVLLVLLLEVGDGPDADVVGGPLQVVLLALAVLVGVVVGVLEDGEEDLLEGLGAEVEVERDGGVDDVDGGEVAVGGDLLHEDPHLLLNVVPDGLDGAGDLGIAGGSGAYLSVDEGGHCDVLVVGDLLVDLVHELLVELGAELEVLLAEGIGTLVEEGDHVAEGVLPEGDEVGAEVADGVEDVVGDDHVLGDGLLTDGAEVEGEGDDGPVVVHGAEVGVVLGVGDVVGEGHSGGSGGEGGGGEGGLGGGGDVPAAPGDAVVPVVEDGGVGDADGDGGGALDVLVLPVDVLAGLAGGGLGGVVVVDLDAVGLAVDGADGVVDVGVGEGDVIDAVDEVGGGEGQGELDLGIAGRGEGIRRPARRRRWFWWGRRRGSSVRRARRCRRSCRP